MCFGYSDWGGFEDYFASLQVGSFSFLVEATTQVVEVEWVVGCFRDNPDMFIPSGVLRDHWAVVLATSGSFLGHKLIFFIQLAAICEGLDFTIHFGYPNIKVESDLATIVL